MFKKGLRTPVESNIATLASMVSFFQNCLFNTQCQMLILGFVNAITRCVSEKRQSFIYNKNAQINLSRRIFFSA
jgi:hypothetical protein